MISSFAPSLKLLVLAVVAWPTMAGAASRGHRESLAVFPPPPLQGQALRITNAGDLGNPLILQIGKPLGAMPSGLPVAEVTRDGRFRGRLIFTIRTQPTAYFVQQMTGISAAAPGSSVAAYPTTAYDAIYDAQFSRDGRSVLFKVGWPFEAHGSFDLFTWDFASKKLQVIQRSLFIESVRWSPDGKWVAYLKGGDKAGRRQYATELWAQSVGTKASRLVAKNVLRNFRWSGGSTLLFTVAGAHSKYAALTGVPPRLDMMQASAPRGAPRPFLRDATQVTPSPDGRWLACMRWETPTQSETSGGVKMHAVQMQLASRYLPPRLPIVVFLNRRTKRSFKVNVTANNTLVWSSDSKTLLVTDLKSEAEDNGRSRHTATVTAVDTATHKRRIVGELESWDFESAGRGYDAPAIAPKIVSRDGRYLYLELSEFYGKAGHMYKQLRKLVALDLRTGESETVASLDDPWSTVVGWDWREELLAASGHSRP